MDITVILALDAIIVLLIVFWIFIRVLMFLDERKRKKEFDKAHKQLLDFYRS